VNVKSTVQQSENKNDEEERKRGLTAFNMVISSLSFNHQTSNAERIRLDGIKPEFNELEEEDFKFELPNTPVEIEPDNSRIVGGLFPGKGFFYLPKTTCFDKEIDEQIYTMEVLQSTLMQNHSKPPQNNFNQGKEAAKSPARFMMEILKKELKNTEIIENRLNHSKSKLSNQSSPQRF
jgi:hypothetical protein